MKAGLESFTDPPPAASPLLPGPSVAAAGVVVVLGCTEVTGVQVEATGGFMLQRCRMQYFSKVVGSSESLPRNLAGSDSSVHTGGVGVYRMDPELFSGPRTLQ